MTESDHAQPGVTVTRRKALKTTGWMMGALCFSAAGRGQDAVPKGAGFERFTQQWLELTGELLEDGEPDEDRYVYRLSALVAALGVDQLPPRTRTSFEKEGMQSGPAYGAGDRFIVEFELEPGAVIQAHNHVGFDFLSVGAEGACHFRHFEPLEDPPPIRGGLREPFPLQQTRRGILTPGRMTTLTRTRDTIHWFQAGEDGAKFFDFGINFKDPGAGYKEFSMLEFDPEPLDAEQAIYEGQWVGRR